MLWNVVFDLPCVFVLNDSNIPPRALRILVRAHSIALQQPQHRRLPPSKLHQIPAIVGRDVRRWVVRSIIGLVS